MRYPVLLILSYLMMVGALNAQPKVNTLYFSVHLEKSLQRDTLTLEYWPYVLDDAVNESLPHKKESVAMDKSGNYIFQMHGIQKAGYISLTTGFDNGLGDDYCWLRYYYAESGDSIHVDIQGDSTYINRIDVLPQEFKMIFTGRGDEKYQCRRLIDQTSSERGDEPARTMRMNALSLYKNKLDAHTFQVIKADVIGNAEYQYMRPVTFAITNISGYRINKNVDKAKIIFENYNRELSRRISINNVPDSVKAFSNGYSQFLYYYNRLKYKFVLKEPEDRFKNFYDYLENEFNGSVRSKMLTMAFLLRGRFSREDKPLLEHAMLFVKNDYFRNRLQQLLNDHLNNYAYDFSLPDTSGRIVRLKDFRGKVVVIDFWHTGCGPCLGYYQEVLKHAEDLLKDNKEVVFITISVDQHKNEWMTSIRDKKYTSPDVVNLFTNGLGVNHPVIEKYNITGYPAHIIISRGGEIYKFNTPELNEVQTLVKAIKTALNS